MHIHRRAHRALLRLVQLGSSSFNLRSARTGGQCRWRRLAGEKEGRRSLCTALWARGVLALTLTIMMIVLAPGLTLARTLADELPPPAVPPLPTDTPPTATPILPIGDPPIVLEASSSQRQAAPNESFSYRIVVSNSSATPRAIEVRTSLTGPIELTGASSSGGPCELDTPIVCQLNVQRDLPIGIIINVRVRADASANSQATAQALAQDDLRNTATSDPVLVMITGAPLDPSLPGVGVVTPALPSPTPSATPTLPPEPTEPPTPAPTEPAAPTEPPAPPQTVAPSPTEVQAEATPSSPDLLVVPPLPPAPLADLVPTEAAVATARQEPAGEPAGDPPEQESPAPVPMQAQDTAPAMNQSMTLPETAATTPVIGIVIGLLGMALAVHSARRVISAEERLTRASVGVGGMATLLRAALVLQRHTAADLERQRDQSQDLLDALASREPRTENQELRTKN